MFKMFVYFSIKIDDSLTFNQFLVFAFLILQKLKIYGYVPKSLTTTSYIKHPENTRRELKAIFATISVKCYLKVLKVNCSNKMIIPFIKLGTTSFIKSFCDSYIT